MSGGLTRRFRRVRGRVVGVRLRAQSPGVRLTFDDGPDPTFTPKLLDVLSAHGAQATFFVTGKSALAHPELVRRMVAEGHAVGSHSFSLLFFANVSLRETISEYRAGREALESVIGRPCLLFRPPGSELGWRSTVAILVLGLRAWLFTVDPMDWAPDRTLPDVWQVLVRAGDSDVVLLHDGMELPQDERARDRGTTLAAVAALLELRGGSTRFVALESV